MKYYMYTIFILIYICMELIKLDFEVFI